VGQNNLEYKGISRTLKIANSFELGEALNIIAEIQIESFK